MRRLTHKRVHTFAPNDILVTEIHLQHYVFNDLFVTKCPTWLFPNSFLINPAGKHWTLTSRGFFYSYMITISFSTKWKRRILIETMARMSNYIT